MLLPEYSLASTHRVGFPVSHLLLPCSLLCTLSLISCNVCGGLVGGVSVGRAGGSGWHVCFACVYVWRSFAGCMCVYVHVPLCSCVFWVSVWLQILKEFKSQQRWNWGWMLPENIHCDLWPLKTCAAWRNMWTLSSTADLTYLTYLFCKQLVFAACSYQPVPESFLFQVLN